MAVSSKTWTVGEIITAANLNMFMRDNDADLQANKTDIKTGQYAGDGNATQAITGLDIQPAFLIIMENVADGASGDMWWTSTTLIDNDPQGLAYTINDAGDSSMQEDAIVTLDADGFTVGDGGGNANNVAKTYEYVAWGA